ncbi:MAG: SDR family oxidoreductase [Pedobacter sp.]|nr:MAG: SDR family oxidoreductase [Pedobacter sp.]
MENLAQLFDKAINGKNVLVTGGSTGIGREITFFLCSLGANCLICGRDPKPLEETVKEVTAKGWKGKCISVECDVAEETAIARLFEKVDNELGDIDVLINNAAIAYGSISEGNYEDWSYAIKTNLMGNLSPTHYAVERMKDKKSGHILFIGSMSAETTDEESSVYVATKSGLKGFAQSLRKEVNKFGIKVTLIEPGAVDTDMQEAPREEKLAQVEKGEMLKASDIALSVVFCLAQASRADIVELQIRPHLQLI